MKRFRGGLVFKAHRLVYHSTLCSRVIKKKKRDGDLIAVVNAEVGRMARRRLCNPRRPCEGMLCVRKTERQRESVCVFERERVCV